MDGDTAPNTNTSNGEGEITNTIILNMPSSGEEDRYFHKTRAQY